jgi:hypothetical protein
MSLSLDIKYFNFEREQRRKINPLEEYPCIFSLNICFLIKQNKFGIENLILKTFIEFCFQKRNI